LIHSEVRINVIEVSGEIVGLDGGYRRDEVIDEGCYVRGVWKSVVEGVSIVLCNLLGSSASEGIDRKSQGQGDET
jgi:hypothetical protein